MAAARQKKNQGEDSSRQSRTYRRWDEGPFIVQRAPRQVNTPETRAADERLKRRMEIDYGVKACEWTPVETDAQ